MVTHITMKIKRKRTKVITELTKPIYNNDLLNFFGCSYEQLSIIIYLIKMIILFFSFIGRNHCSNILTDHRYPHKNL